MDNYGNDYLDYSDDDDDNRLMHYSSHVLSSESEDEHFDEELLKGKLGRKNVVKKADSDDDFEKDMDAELMQTMTMLTAPLLQESSDTQDKSSSQKKVTFGEPSNIEGEKIPECYDDVYFDSDDSEPEEGAIAAKSSSKNKAHSKRKILSNDELFYDPDMDDRDQEWVDRQRRSYQINGGDKKPATTNKRKTKIISKKSGLSKPPNSTKSKASTSYALPQSDAVLNCPGCLTTLCYDCQRHSIYKNQYRAMFVFHCKIDATERLKFPKKDKKSFLKAKKKKAKEKKMKIEKCEAPITPKEENTSSINNSDSNKDHALVTSKVENTSCMETVAPASCKEETPDSKNDESAIPKEDNTSSIQTEESNKNVASISFKEEIKESHKNEAPLTPKEENVGTLETPKGIEDDGFIDLPDEDEEYFHSVSCDVCNTKVGVYDEDEVFHFFNIVTSY